MQKVWKIPLLLCLCWLLAGCENYPKDPNDTLAQVTGGTLVVGYSENPPWVTLGPNGHPGGVEADLVRGFAKTIQAQITWKRDTEQNLLEELEEKKLHLVLAGLTDDSPWKSKISFTRPYLEQGKKKHVFGVVMGENAFVTKLEKYLHQKEDSLKTRYGHATPQ
ncbi:transporter substrate-binding domain-containing protein [Nibribacter ruber]|uniref:Transporter substrate-binding domain-containing protein n=1 Tax=Nibribacter ruber TaxID=2698458 RepID=A0A6P1NXA7_9BACT|nr:transporter substrate-binding domain-containing protein [Nibribacter ruber]QHL86964.1 transporter substrate-binding domain-containing protein [Nibribacter ruber]